MPWSENSTQSAVRNGTETTGVVCHRRVAVEPTFPLCGLIGFQSETRGTAEASDLGCRYRVLTRKATDDEKRGPMQPPCDLNCPRCGKPLSALQGHRGSLAFYHCLRHGRFWIDEDGRLREERRSSDRAT